MDQYTIKEIENLFDSDSKNGISEKEAKKRLLRDGENSIIGEKKKSIFFYSTLVEWASGSNLLYYTIVGLVGWNFVLEFALNAILSPVIMRIVNIRNKDFE